MSSCLYHVAWCFCFTNGRRTLVGGFINNNYKISDSIQLHGLPPSRKRSAREKPTTTSLFATILSFSLHEFIPVSLRRNYFVLRFLLLLSFILTTVNSYCIDIAAPRSNVARKSKLNRFTIYNQILYPKRNKLFAFINPTTARKKSSLFMQSINNEDCTYGNASAQISQQLGKIDPIEAHCSAISARMRAQSINQQLESINMTEFIFISDENDRQQPFGSPQSDENYISSRSNEAGQTKFISKHVHTSLSPSTTRRQAMESMWCLGTATVFTVSVLPAYAGIAELDTSTGNLFTPKNVMLSGGSQAARGITVTTTNTAISKNGGGVVQSIYETRFVAYLSRFLLNYEPSARAWWIKQEGISSLSWDTTATAAAVTSAARGGELQSSVVEDASPTVRSSTATTSSEAAFAEFAQSVEFGLSDYFSGPFGSYSSVSAAIAGLNAAQPAPSKQSNLPRETLSEIRIDLRLIIERIFAGKDSSNNLRRSYFNDSRKQEKLAAEQSLRNAKQGILNLYALLKARYSSVSAKRQLAILFSFISSPALQPTNEICSLLGEIDNATVTQIQLMKPPINNNVPEWESRTSPRRGGGYSINDPLPVLSIGSPPPLGDNYRSAEVKPIMKPTSRILRIEITDGGEGYYTSAPAVTIVPWGSGGIFPRPCQAIATIDRDGHVDSIVVLDPGWGYDDAKNGPPKVRIEPPPKSAKQQQTGQIQQRSTTRRATAVAELEYEIVGIDVIQGGNGYVKDEPPTVKISPPLQDPDWFLYVQEQPELRMVPIPQSSFQDQVYGKATEMKFADGNIAYAVDRTREFPGVGGAVITDELIGRVRRDPVELLPSSVRPELVVPNEDIFSSTTSASNNKLTYSISQIAAIPQNVVALSPRYRACDPLFGGVGKLPVTKSASALSASEYGRLALSGALCTVVVRTALNPLELIKTKQQLRNDEELLEYALAKKEAKLQTEQKEPPPISATSVRGSQSITVLPPSRPPSFASSSRTGNLMILSTTPVASLTTPTETKSKLDVSAGIDDTKPIKVGTIEMIQAIVELRGLSALFQGADITFLASLVFGSFGFGATELFRRSFTTVFAINSGSAAPLSASSSEVALLLAASVATVVTAAAAAPFEVLRVRSMGTVEAKKWPKVLQEFLAESENSKPQASRFAPKSRAIAVTDHEDFDFKTLKPRDLLPLWSGFAPTVSRELPFAIAKFLTFDLIASTILRVLNAQAGDQGSLPVQVGVGPIGLTISALAGAVAGIAGAIVSHPADLILTKTSATKKKVAGNPPYEASLPRSEQGPQWVVVVKEIVGQEGGVANLFVGLGARSVFFFLVIGLQFFLYDYVKNLFQVGSDDLSLVLDIFYAVRAGLAGVDTY